MNCEIRSVSLTQNQNIFEIILNLFLNPEVFILAWIKPVLCSLPSKSDLSPDQPDQLPSKKCLHSLFEQNHLKTIQ